MAQMDLLQREMDRMDRRMSAIEQALMEAQQAAATVRALGEAKGEVEALVPLGGGVHAKARLDAASPILMPIGAGYATEATPEAVAEALRQRVESLAQQLRQAHEEAERVAQAASALNEHLSN